MNLIIGNITLCRVVFIINCLIHQLQKVPANIGNACIANNFLLKMDAVKVADVIMGAANAIKGFAEDRRYFEKLSKS